MGSHLGGGRPPSSPLPPEERWRDGRGARSHYVGTRRELLDTGIASTGHSIDDIIADCWSKFEKAKLAVQANAPTTYISSSNLSQDP